MEQGYSTLRLGYKEVYKGQGREIPCQIRNQEIVGIAVNYQQWKKHVPEDMIEKFHKELSLWFKHAKGMNVPMYVFGFTGNHWKQYPWEQLLLTN